MIKILDIKTKGRYDFRNAFDSLPRNQQPQFRHAVMASQNWTARNTFYTAMRGGFWLTGQQIQDIKAIFRKFGQEVE